MALPSPGEFDWSPLLVATVAATAGVLVVAHRGARTPAHASHTVAKTRSTTEPSLDTMRSTPAGTGSRDHTPSADAMRAAPAGTGSRNHPPSAATLTRSTRWRAVSAAGGVIVLAAAFLSPLATLAAHYLLTVHLVQVTLVMGVAPPLLLLGLPRRLPVPTRPLRALGRVLVHPACAIVLVNLVFFGWHAPVLYDAALQHPAIYALQQVMLLLVSLAFWWAIVEPAGKGPWSMSGLFKLGYILLATIPQTFAGLTFALAHHTFYAPYVAAPRITGLDALGDQQLAGALMAILSKLALFAAFSVILWRVLDAHGADGESDDDGGSGGDDDQPRPMPPGSPAWLDLLRRGRTIPEPAPLQPREPRVPGERRPTAPVG